MKSEKEVEDRFNELIKNINDMVDGFSELKEEGELISAETFAGQIKALAKSSEANTLSWVLENMNSETMENIEKNKKKLEEALITAARSLNVSLDD